MNNVLTKVRYLCAVNGISIRRLEQELGFSEKLIFKWEKHTPSFENIKKVADYFGVSVDFFLDDEDKADNEIMRILFEKPELHMLLMKAKHLPKERINALAEMAEMLDNNSDI